MATLPQQITLEAFLKPPERKPALEYDHGVVTRKAVPLGQHSVLQTGIGTMINRFARPRKLAWALPELRITYGDCSRVPDLAVYRWERIPVDERGEIADDFVEPPDLVVEIVAPRETGNWLVRRCLSLVTEGVKIVLLVDPVDRSVLLFRPGQQVRAACGADQLDLADVLPGFTISAQEIFDDLTL